MNSISPSRLLYGWLGAFFGLLFCISTEAAEPGQAYFNHLQTVKTRYGIKRIQDLLPFLPSELRANFVLMFKSRSLQEATYLAPRVILYSPQSDFIMTFNGDKSQEGFESIETVRFIHSENRFIFEEILFDGDLKSRMEFLSQKGETQRANYLLDRSTRTGPNPPVCRACHQSDPRPNWEHYSFWPGAYGQFDNAQLLNGRTVQDDPVDGAAKTYNNSAAAKSLPEFVALADRHPRYKSLVNLKSILKLGKDQSGRYGRSENSNLFTFTAHVSALNFKRIVRIMKSHRNYDQLKWTVFSYQKAICGGPEFSGYQDFLDYLSLRLNVRRNFLSMNFIEGKGNALTTPGLHLSELLYVLTTMDPPLRKYVTSTGKLLSTYNGVERSIPIQGFTCNELNLKYRSGSVE